MTSVETATIRTLAPKRGLSLRSTISKYYFMPALLLAAVLLIAYVVVRPNVNWPQLFATFAPFALLAMASAPAIMSGGPGLDLSISPVAILCGAVYAMWLVPNGLGAPWIALPIVLAVGTCVGLINGLIVTRLRIPAIVATLAMSFVIAGVNLLVAPTSQTVPSGWVRDLAGSWGGFPVAALVIAVPLVIWGLLRLTPYVTALMSVGGNDVAAYSAGIPVAGVRVFAYALGGFIASLAGLSLVALAGSVDPSTSNTYILPALVSVALGGIAIEGGRGGMAGAIAGATIIFVLQALLAVLGIPAAWLQVMYGLLLAGAIIFSRMLTNVERSAE